VDKTYNGETFYANGPVPVELESTATCCHGLLETNGTTGSSCAYKPPDPQAAGSPVAAQFGILAADQRYRLNGAGAQVLRR